MTRNNSVFGDFSRSGCHCCSYYLQRLNPLGVNSAKWSNTLKQFVVDHFVGLALKGLTIHSSIHFVSLPYQLTIDLLNLLSCAYDLYVPLAAIVSTLEVHK